MAAQLSVGYTTPPQCPYGNRAFSVGIYIKKSEKENCNCKEDNLWEEQESEEGCIYLNKYTISLMLLSVNLYLLFIPAVGFLWNHNHRSVGNISLSADCHNLHSTQTYYRRTRGKSLTAASYSISRLMSSPHIITANLSCDRLVMRAFKVQSKCIYAFDPISMSLYHVAVGLLGSLSVGSNLRPPDRSMTSQTLFFCLVNPTAPSEEIQLNLSFKEYVTAGA